MHRINGNVSTSQCGFLNRKSVLETSGKKSKDRTWQTFWCQVKDGKMEFYKVNGFSLRPHGEPPPKDIYPPPNKHKQNAGCVFLENSLVELDYTSQEEKDLEKRRKHLFRLILCSNTEFLFQAPSENIMLQWVSHIKKATLSTTDPDLGGPTDLTSDARIKASRCSINKKSKHNTNSVRVTANVDADDEINSSLVSLIRLDPRLIHLKKRLQTKRDLMRQLQKMLSSFSGDTECLYKEAETLSSRLTSRSGSIPPEEEAEKPFSRPSVTSSVLIEGFLKTTTTLMEDYYMIPGVEWSLLRKGETVEVLGKLPGGWYQCRANKDTAFELEEFPTDFDRTADISEDANLDDERDALTSTPVLLKESKHDHSLLSEISSSLGEEFIPKVFESEEKVEKDNLQRTKSINMAFDNSVLNELDDHRRDRTNSYMLATTSDPLETFRRQNLARKDSYNTATSYGSVVDSAESARHLKHLSMIEFPSPRTPSPLDGSVPSTPSGFSQEYELKRLRINNILDHEKANNRYVFPLVGVIPASVLNSFVSPTSFRPSSSTSDYVSSSGAVIHDVVSSLNGHVKSSSFDATVSTNNHESSEGSRLHESKQRFPSDELVPIDIERLKKRHSDRSMSLPTSSLSPLDSKTDERHSPEALSPEPNDDELENDVIEDKEREKESEGGEQGNLKRRRSSKSLKVIPSPTSTLDRKIQAVQQDDTMNDEHEKELKQQDSIQHKRSNSDCMEEKHQKGIISRIRSNISGLKKGNSESPKRHFSPGIPSHVLEDFETRNRVTSISGKRIKSAGMGITFGESSSESESDESEERSLKNSKLLDSTSGSDKKHKYNDKDQNHSSENTGRSKEPEFGANKISSNTNKSNVTATPTQTDESSKSKSEPQLVNGRRNSFLQDGGTNMSGFIQAPPRGTKRHIQLDPSVKKFGFHLEKYELQLDGKNVSQTIIQHVVPGSPAFVAGFFPGDQIIAVNGQNLQYASVQEVANAIQQADPNKNIEVVVIFVEGAIRIKKKQERGDLQIKLVEKQKNLESIITTEQKHENLLPEPNHFPCTTEYVSPEDLHSWREDTPPEENSLHIYNYNKLINNILSLHHGDITQLQCDMLVIPLQKSQSHIQEDDVTSLLKAGGDGLKDDLSLSCQCDLGNNIYTEGHKLPAKTVCHCVFSTNDDDIFRCCRQALKKARQDNYENIVFWISGFISTSFVSPHHIICAVRGWLEEGDNCHAFSKVILSVPSTPAMISLIERYFPLEDYKLYDFLQELHYFTSDDEDEENMNSKITDRDIPNVPPRPNPPGIAPPVPAKSKFQVQVNQVNRAESVKTKFNEIDDILKDIKCQVASLKK